MALEKQEHFRTKNIQLHLKVNQSPAPNVWVMVPANCGRGGGLLSVKPGDAAASMFY